MNRACRRALMGFGFLLLAVGALGCVKRVPVESGVFEAQQKVLLTLKDGRSLRGRIRQDQTVLYRAEGVQYRAKVQSVTEQAIVLRDLVQVETDRSYDQVAQRLSDARVRVAEPIPSLTLDRAEVEKVELIRFDAATSARRIGFWAYGGALVVILLGEHS